MGVSPFIGEIAMFAGNFPRGWAMCNGQILQISQNQALFSLLGTTYGGNGQTTFALPDLRGRVPVGMGQGAGMNIVQGEASGAASHTLLTSELPPHNHLVRSSSAAGTSANPNNNGWASSTARDNVYSATDDGTMRPTAIANTGGGQPHNNMQPYLGLNFIIALEGIFPARN